MTVKLDKNVLQRAMTSLVRDKVIVEECEFFPKKEFRDGKWVQSNCFRVKFKHDIDMDTRIGEVSVNLKKAISDIERLMGVEIIYEYDMIPLDLNIE